MASTPAHDAFAGLESEGRPHDFVIPRDGSAGRLRGTPYRMCVRYHGLVLRPRESGELIYELRGHPFDLSQH